MRNKILSFLLSAAVLLTLCGCDFTEPDRQYIAAAMGFDEQKGGLSLSVEAVIINSENTDEDIKTEVFKSFGKTPEECLYNLTVSLPKKLSLSHCGIVAVGDGVSPEQFLEIIELCKEHRDINLSAYVISSPDANALLSSEAASALAVGFELMSAIEQSEKKTGVLYGNRIYEIENSLSSRSPAFSLARFSTREKGFTLDGSRVFMEGNPCMDLVMYDTVVYSLMRNRNRGGAVSVNGRVYKLGSPYTYFTAERVGENIKVSLKIRISEEISPILCRDIEQTARRLFDESEDDVFGFADRIYAKYPGLRDAADNRNQDYVFNVTCEMGKQKDEM